MQLAFLHLVSRLRSLIKQESGQDLVEYALVVALIALGATIGMKQLAGGIDKAFNSVSVALATDIQFICGTFLLSAIFSLKKFADKLRNIA